MKDFQAIADIIRKRVKIQNLQIGAMLKSCGLGGNTVSELSKGKQISFVSLAKIADELDCSVDYLLGRTENPAAHKTQVAGVIAQDEAHILKLYRDFNDEGKEKATSYLDDMAQLDKYKKESHQSAMADEA